MYTAKQKDTHVIFASKSFYSMVSFFYSAVWGSILSVLLTLLPKMNILRTKKDAEEKS
jgi:hypothetical protein